MKFTKEESVGVLLEEWRICEGAIRGYDEIGMKIKTWAITLFSGSIYLAISTSSPGIAIAFLPAAFAFWFFDALYKGYQLNFIARSRELSNYLRVATDLKGSSSDSEQSLNEFVFPGYDEKFAKHGEFNSALICMLHWNIAALYVPLSVLSFMVAFAAHVR